MAESPAAADAAAPPRRALRMLVICYLFLGALYLSKLPPGSGPDETAHVRYVEYLAQHHRLPVFDHTHPGPDYEFHQPPLYYTLCLPSYLLAARDPAAAAQAVRFFSLLVSVALLYLTFALGRAIAPDRPWAALAAAGIVAFLPMRLYLSACIGNDGLTEVWVAAALLVMIYHLRAAARHRAGETPRPAGLSGMIATGLLIGLGVMTKSLAILLLPAAWLTAAFSARGPDRYQWRWLARDVAVVTGLVLVVAGWWLLRNQHLYGDPLAQQAFLSGFEGRSPSPQDMLHRFGLTHFSYLIWVVGWTAASFTGVFGPRFEVFLPRQVYLVTGLVSLVGGVAFARYLTKAGLSAWQRQAWWLCALVGALMVAAFVRFNISFFQAQARYIFPGLLPAAALAFSLGVEDLAPARLKRALPLAVPIGLALLSSVGLLLWILPQLEAP